MKRTSVINDVLFYMSICFLVVLCIFPFFITLMMYKEMYILPLVLVVGIYLIWIVLLVVFKNNVRKETLKTSIVMIEISLVIGILMYFIGFAIFFWLIFR